MKTGWTNNTTEQKHFWNSAISLYVNIAVKYIGVSNEFDSEVL